jgi:hypothetical protein
VRGILQRATARISLASTVAYAWTSSASTLAFAKICMVLTAALSRISTASFLAD